MFKRFTERARRVIILAREEAERYRHEYLGTEHILQGLLKDGGGIAIAVFRKIGIDIDQMKIEIESNLPTSSNVLTIGDIPFTAGAKKVLEFAVEEARAMGHNYIGTEHLLLGLIREKHGIASKILNNFGIHIAETRKHILNILKEPSSQAKETSKTPILDEFSRDLTALAVQGNLDPVIGRNSEIERVIQIISRRTKNNPVLIGEAGVGKTAIVEGLASKIVEREIPEILYDRRVIALDLGSLIAGTKYRGQFEARLKGIMKEITRSNSVILFIDELHTLVGAGAAEGSVDASNMLKPALARGEVQCVGATTLEEYRKYIEKNAALERRFQPIMVDPPTPDETILILKELKDEYEAHHNVTITEEAIVGAVRLSDRYISDRFLPDKAIDVIDEAGSRVRLREVTYPPNVRELQRKIDKIVREKKSKIESQEFEKAVELRDKEEELRYQLELLKEEWKKSRKDIAQVVTYKDAAHVVSKMTGVPLSKIEKDESQRLMEMEENLSRVVVGQEEAIKVVTKAVRRSRAGIKNLKRPIGSFLFLGPTGVGKTELAYVLAEFLFGDRNALIRLDMSEYMEKFNVSRLTGAPPGYVGYEEGGQLTEKVRRKPYSLILFDEIEKAHPDIYHILLQIMDDGKLTDSYGRVVNFRNAILIMTSNLSARTLEKGTSMGFQKERGEEYLKKMKEKIVKGDLKRTFNPEFLSRIDEIVIFNHLKKEHIIKIVDLHLAELNERLAEEGLYLEVTKEVREWLADKGYDQAFGARPLKKAIQKYIENPLAERMLFGEFKDGGAVEIRVEDKELIFIDKKENMINSYHGV
ncbi:MAG: ATP-dependent Clp protease ATP-binding subunit [Nitrospinota bacterium]